MPLDYTGHIRSESARFVDVLAAARPQARVPSCPDWDAADLLWHLTEVQAFWGQVVSLQAQSADDVPTPDRPAAWTDLVAAFRHWSDHLVTALGDADDATPVWTWSDDHSVGFIRRRQAHEALIHRLDAELTTDSVTPLPTPLAADGVLEALDVMYGGCPPWGTFTPDGRRISVECTDTGDRFGVELGRFTGTDPDDGTTYDEADLSVVDLTEPPLATLRGTADDLDAWIWSRREPDAIAFEGDWAALAVVRAILGQPIN